MSTATFEELSQAVIDLDYDEKVSLLALLAQSLRSIDSKPVPEHKRKFGAAKGKFVYPENFDEDNEEIAKMFGVI